MSQPDLFVVCRNCGSEVSPYVTECPYCGQRVRKRAPKLERAGEDAEPRVKQRRRPRLSRLRPDEIEGIAPETKPRATIALIVVSLAVTVALATRQVSFVDVGGLLLGAEEEPWRWVTAPFVYAGSADALSLGYQFVVLVAVGVFGTLLERRFGAVAVVGVFLLAGVSGMATATALALEGPFGEPVILGGNGAALGLAAAWLADDRLAARRGVDRESDVMGALVFGLLLLLLPLAVLEASPVAGVEGALVGALAGMALPTLTRRA